MVRVRGRWLGLGVGLEVGARRGAIARWVGLCAEATEKRRRLSGRRRQLEKVPAVHLVGVGVGLGVGLGLVGLAFGLASLLLV